MQYDRNPNDMKIICIVILIQKYNTLIHTSWTDCTFSLLPKGIHEIAYCQKV